MESVRNETKIIQTTENLETIKVEKLRKWALLGHKARNKPLLQSVTNWGRSSRRRRRWAGYTKYDIEAEKHCIEYRVWNRFVTFKGLWLNVDSRSTRVKACWDQRETEGERWSGEGSVPSACNLHTLNYCGPSCQFVSKLNLNLIIVTNKWTFEKTKKRNEDAAQKSEFFHS